MKKVKKWILFLAISILLFGLCRICFENFKGINGSGYFFGMDEEVLIFICTGAGLVITYFVLPALAGLLNNRKNRDV